MYTYIYIYKYVFYYEWTMLNKDQVLTRHFCFGTIVHVWIDFPFLLTYINFNPSMDTLSYAQ